VIAPMVGADPVLSQRAARLAKADLVTGMVGEFPELQGVMGRYYALHDGEDASIADAIRDHYAPKGPTDEVPTAAVSVAVALADKIDLLARFFAIDERPTGSGDPYALRRAALGIVRIVREQSLRLHLLPLMSDAVQMHGLSAIQSDRFDEALHTRSQRSEPIGFGVTGPDSITSTQISLRNTAHDLLAFIVERLRVQLRTEGARYDVLAAVIGLGIDDDLVRVLARTDAVAKLLGTEDGSNLLSAYRRAANILRIEEKKDGSHNGEVDPAFLDAPAEVALTEALDSIDASVTFLLAAEDFSGAMETLASLHPKLDAFFENVTVNDPRPDIRRNRLRLLSRVRAAMHLAADFSKIEG